MDTDKDKVSEVVKSLVDLLKTNIAAIVDRPDLFEVTHTMNGQILLLVIACDEPAEIGKLIGKEGKNITALIRLVTIAGVKNKMRVSIHTPDRRRV